MERRQMMKLFRDHMSLAHPTQGKLKSAFMTGEGAYAASGASDSNTQENALGVQIRAPSTKPNKRKMNAPGNKSKQFHKRNIVEAGDVCPACEQRHDINNCFYVNQNLETPEWFRPNKHIEKLVHYKLQNDLDLPRAVQEVTQGAKRPRLMTSSRSITPHIKISYTPDSTVDWLDGRVIARLDESTIDAAFRASNQGYPLKDAFILDSGSTTHICNNLSRIKHMRPPAIGDYI
jgi:hypothetical protein